MKVLSIITALVIAANCLGQDSVTTEVRPAQVTFISPLGTNGLDAAKYTNQFSLNIIGGYNGGLDGVELGGFANVLAGDMHGAQFAGFSNTVWEETHGAQFAGFTNVSRGYLFGAQFAGFANTVVDSAFATQVAGFSNVAKGSNNGVQLAGFSNVTAGDMAGFQGSGFSNVVRGELRGAQASGFVNTVVGDLKGPQIAGFVNTTSGEVQGNQVAGFVNVAGGDVQGVQVAGFVNRARNVSGWQVGFINVADSVSKGTPIGFLSIVKNGYRRFELSASETFFAGGKFKIGTSKFYNIFAAGVKPTQRELYWAYGYGIGTSFSLGGKWRMNFDQTAYHINNGPGFTDDLSFLSKTHMGFSYAPAGRFELFGGPTLNVLVSGEFDGEGFPVETIVNDFVYKYENQDVLVGLYPGLNLGVRF